MVNNQDLYHHEQSFGDSEALRLFRERAARAAMQGQPIELGSERPSTAYERAMEQFQAEQRAYAEEIRELQQGGNDYDGLEQWQQAMRNIGRLS